MCVCLLQKVILQCHMPKGSHGSDWVYNRWNPHERSTSQWHNSSRPVTSRIVSLPKVVGGLSSWEMVEESFEIQVGAWLYSAIFPTTTEQKAGLRGIVTQQLNMSLGGP